MEKNKTDIGCMVCEGICIFLYPLWYSPYSRWIRLFNNEPEQTYLLISRPSDMSLNYQAKTHILKEYNDGC